MKKLHTATDMYFLLINVNLEQAQGVWVYYPYFSWVNFKSQSHKGRGIQPLSLYRNLSTLNIPKGYNCFKSFLSFVSFKKVSFLSTLFRQTIGYWCF